MKNIYRLYGYKDSSATQRVKIVMNYKKIDYQYISVDLSKGEQFIPHFQKISPRMVVPVLQINDNQTLIESLPICQYLDENHDEKFQLLTRNPTRRAQILGVCEVIATSIQPYQYPGILQFIKQKNPESKMNWADLWKYWNLKGLRNVQNIISKHHGQFCFGNNITLADVVLFAQMHHASLRFGIDFSELDVLIKIKRNLDKCESFIK